MTESTFEIAQALRRSHCDRPSQSHECVGEVTIKRGEVCLNCQLCGTGQDIPGWNSRVAEMLDEIFIAAGINWHSLDMQAKRNAVLKYRELHRLE